MIELINDARRRHGLSELVENSILMSAAQQHSEYMAQINKLTHNGPRDTTGYGSTYIGQCIAWGTSTEKETVDLWMADAAHRRIILDKTYIHIGVGFSGQYWTADFGYTTKEFKKTLDWNIL